MKRLNQGLYAACISLCLIASLSHAELTPIAIQLKESIMHQIRGSFDVKLQPQAPAAAIAEAHLGRQTIDKQFHGELDAHSLGEMLAAMTEVKGSAGYVAIERVNGTLQGKRGSFVLMHTGVMDKGTPHLTIQVVPDSATDELVGLKGQMQIEIKDGKHFYMFDYSLP